MTFQSKNEMQTAALAASLAANCRAGDCILLHGDLGAGKTAFARGFIGALCDGSPEVVSPTFTLAQSYPARGGLTLWHFDLYRLKDSREAEQIGLDDALQSGLCLIEWPEIARGQLPDTALEVHLEYGQGEGERIITFRGNTAWQPRLGEHAA